MLIVLIQDSRQHEMNIKATWIAKTNLGKTRIPN